MERVPMPGAPGIKRIFRGIPVSAGITAVTVLLTEILRYYELGAQNLVLLYVLSTILITRFTAGYLFGIFFAAANTFIYDYFVTDPRLGFSFTVGFPITLVIMLAVSLITSMVTMQMKKQAELAQRSRRRAELMRLINEELLSARGYEAISSLALKYIVEHTGKSAVFYWKQQGQVQSVALDENQAAYAAGPLLSRENTARAHQLFDDPALCDSFNGPAADVYFTVAVKQGKGLGIVGIMDPENGLDKNALAFVRALMGQVAMALELQGIFDRQNRLMIDTEKEKMRSTLLRAISHDLRTPLTGILSAGSIILSHCDRNENPEDFKLATDIKDNSEWLIRMVENLLTVTRISEGSVKVHKTSEVAEEAMGKAVSMVRNRFPDCSIHARSLSDPVLVPMDAILISQVFINLLENAVKNSPEGVLVMFDMQLENGYARFDVSDQGEGIPADIMNDLFNKHISNGAQAVDSVSGMGIGLSICKTIVDAHDGKIAAVNRNGGGAKFSVFLPLEDRP